MSRNKIYQVDIESENEDDGPSCEYIEIEDSKSFHQLSPELLKPCQPALQDAVIVLSDSDSEGTSTSNNTLLRGLNKEVASRVRGRKRKASTGRAGSAASSTIDKWYQRQAAVVPTSKA